MNYLLGCRIALASKKLLESPLERAAGKGSLLAANWGSSEGGKGPGGGRATLQKPAQSDPAARTPQELRDRGGTPVAGLGEQVGSINKRERL